MYRGRMNQQELFLLADATLRSVIDQLTPEQLALPAPTAWSRTENPTLRDIGSRTTKLRASRTN